MRPDVLEQARALVPAWVTWGVLVYAPLFAGAGVLLQWLLIRGLVKTAAKAPPDPWYERAGLVFRARVTANAMPLLAFLMPLLLGVILALLEPSLLAKKQLFGWLLVGVISLVACARFGRGALKALRPPEVQDQGSRGALTAFIVMRGTLVPLLGCIFGATWCSAPWSFLFLAGIALVVLFASSGASALLKALKLLEPADERLKRAVERAETLVGKKAAGVFVVAFPAANAFALPGPGVIAFTRPALRVLDEEELTVVAAHELDHVKRPGLWNASRAVLVAGILAPLGLVAAGVDLGLLGLLGILVWVLAALIVSTRLRRKMEEHADHAGHHAQVDEQKYARALEKLYRVNQIPPVMGVRLRAHPELYDRMKAAGVDPGYPRPKPPRRRPPFLPAVGMAALLAVLIVLAMDTDVAQTEPELLRSMLLGGGRSRELSALAQLRMEAGETDQALVFARAAWSLKPQDGDAALQVASIEAANGNCDDAQLILDQVREGWENRTMYGTERASDAFRNVEADLEACGATSNSDD